MKDSMPSSVRGKSRSYYNTLANTTELPHNTDGTIASLKNGRKPGQANRYVSICPKEKDDRCPVQFVIFCAKESKCWFLSAPKKKDDFTCRCFHNHLKVLPSHLSTPTNKIPPAFEDYITNA